MAATQVVITTELIESELVLKKPFEPSIELTRDSVIESGVYTPRKVKLNEEAPCEEQFGTRVKGTDSLLYRILQTPAHRTEDILARFIGAAIIPTPPQDIIRAREEDSECDCATRRVRDPQDHAGPC
jgi:hypothetical protein